jgi:hypothetical protein
MNDFQVACHEVGHLLALLECGVCVEYVRLGSEASCHCPHDIAPAAVVLAATAGYVNSRLHGFEDVPSPIDERRRRQALAELGLVDSAAVVAYCERQADEFLRGTWRQQEPLLERLYRKRLVDYGDLCQLMTGHHRLWQYRGQYEKPRPQARSAPRLSPPPSVQSRKSRGQWRTATCSAWDRPQDAGPTRRIPGRVVVAQTACGIFGGVRKT